MFKIAIIEDSPLFSLYVDHKIRKHHNFIIDVFATGEEFLGHSNNKYDAIILDFDLPGINGLAVIKRLKEEKITSPVIVLSGEKNTKNISNLLKENVHAYFEKDNESMHELLDNLEVLEWKKINRPNKSLIKTFLNYFKRKS